MAGPGWQPAGVLDSTPRSWNETGEVVGRIARDPAAGELPGPLPVALALSRGDGRDGQRVAIIGDADGAIEDGILVLRIDLRPEDARD